MKATGRPRIALRIGIPLVGAAMALAGGPASSWGQAPCDPACAPNQTCVQGTCMIPAQPTAPPPPPAYTPPPAYPPPPAGYQAAPPANSYPPPQGNVYVPPTQGYPPPQQGGYSYPPPPPPGMSQRRGFLALPYIGLNSYQGDTGENVGAGFRIGTLLGGHINEHISLNGELTIDAINIENAVDGTEAADLVIAFSPLYHIPSGNVDVVIGPKLGGRVGVTTVPVGDEDATATLTGSVLGLNAGVFGAVSDGVSLGGLFSAEIRTVGRYCEKLPGAPEACSTNNTGPSDKVIGFMAAALF